MMLKHKLSYLKSKNDEIYFMILLSHILFKFIIFFKLEKI